METLMGSYYSGGPKPVQGMALWLLLLAGSVLHTAGQDEALNLDHLDKRFELHTADQCFGQAIPIKCRQDSMVQVTQVFYRQSQRCYGSFHSNFCTQEEPSNPACVGNRTCVFTTPYIYLSPECGYSNNFLVSYKCVPAHLSRDVCEEGELTANSGYITSPNYPAKYSASRTCKVTITTAPGTVIHVYLLDLYLAYYNYDVARHCVDRLWVVGRRDHRRTDFLCSGQQRGLIFTSEDNQVTIYFSSKDDQFLNAKGFWIFYQAVNKRITKILPTIRITKPNIDTPAPTTRNTHVLHRLIASTPTAKSRTMTPAADTPYTTTLPATTTAATTTTTIIHPTTTTTSSTQSPSQPTTTATTPTPASSYSEALDLSTMSATTVQKTRANTNFHLIEPQRVSTRSTARDREVNGKGYSKKPDRLSTIMGTSAPSTTTIAVPSRRPTTAIRTAVKTEITKAYSVARNTLPPVFSSTSADTLVVNRILDVSVDTNAITKNKGKKKPSKDAQARRPDAIKGAGQNSPPKKMENKEEKLTTTAPQMLSASAANATNSTVTNGIGKRYDQAITTTRMKVPLWTQGQPEQAAVFYKKISDTMRRGIVGGAGGCLVLVLGIIVLVILIKRRRNKKDIAPPLPPGVKPENYDDIILAYGSNETSRGFINVGFENESVQDFSMDATSQGSGSLSSGGWGGTIGSWRGLNPIDEGPEIVYMDAKTAAPRDKRRTPPQSGRGAGSGKAKWVKSKSLDDIRHTIRYTQRQMGRGGARRVKDQDREPFTLSMASLEDDVLDRPSSASPPSSLKAPRLQGELVTGGGRQYSTLTNLTLEACLAQSETTLYSNPSTTYESPALNRLNLACLTEGHADDVSKNGEAGSSRGDSPYETVHFHHQEEVAL